MKNQESNTNSFWKRISCTHRKLSSKYKELDSVLTILGVMAVGTTVITLCNMGTSTSAEVKVSLTNDKAEEYYFQGEYSKAITEYKKKEQDQQWPYYEAKLAEVYSAAGDIKRSNELIDEVVRKRMTLISQDDSEQYKNGDAELGCLVSYLAFINDNDNALDYAKSFYNDNKDDFNLNVMMFTLYASKGDKDSAIDILDSLSENDDATSYELAVISQMYITIGENDKGIDLLKEAWYKDKNDIKVYDVMSEITESKVNNLSDEIEKRAQEDREDKIFYKICLLRHYSDDALYSTKFNKLKTEIDSNYAGSYVVELIKQDFFKKQNNGITQKIVKDLIDDNSDSYSVNNIIARYYENDGNLKTALEYTTKSVKNNKFYDYNYTNNIPSEIKEKNENVKIEPYYRQAIYNEPYNLDSILELADYYKDKLGNNDKAYEFYELASRIDQDNSEIIYKMALVKMDQNQMDDAIKLLDTCKKINSQVAKYYRTAGKIYYNNCKNDKAIEEIRKAYEVDKDDIMTLNNAGCYYISTGENFERGLYNLKCAYEMIKGSDDTEVKSIITKNYETAKQIKKVNSDNGKYTINPTLFEMFN